MKNKKEKGITFIIILLSFLFLYLIIDYLNIFSKIGLNNNYLNKDYLNIVVGAWTALFIFSLTYNFVERRNIEKLNNQHEVAIVLLCQVYKQCLLLTKNFNDVALKSLVEQTDFNKRYFHDSPSAKFSNIPFENETSILNFFYDGILNSELLASYFEIKDKFISFVTLSVIFHDHLEMVSPTSEELVKIINHEIEELNHYL